MITPHHPALHGLSIFERGWLSSNNVLVHGDGAGAALIDSSHCLHAEQTLALVRRALGSAADVEPLAVVVNTHLHSDHCGGNAAVQREFGAPLWVPAASWDAVKQWNATGDEGRLGYAASGQRCERFDAQGTIDAGQRVALGARTWEVIGAPGHDPDSVILFDAQEGVLISADALWENGFGVLFPEIDGTPKPTDAFDAVEALLTLIETLPVRWVIPGHGAPFDDVAAALKRARSRLAGFRADPARHAVHAIKVLLKYHLLEERSQALPDLQRWFEAMPMAHRAWTDLGRPDGTAAAWCERLVDVLGSRGVLARRDGVVFDA